MLKIEPKEINLGEVTFDKEYTMNFSVTNTSDKEVDIFKLSAGCSSCTTATMSVPKLKPGQTSPIVVVFKPASSGIQTKIVNVFYKAGEEEQPSIVLKFKANVVK